MAQLDETISTDQAGHIDDHEQLHKKANYVYDVRDFGATGQGFTDDTVAVQAAINAADAVGGGVVLFPTGKYAVTQIDLTGTTGIVLRGTALARDGVSNIRTHSTGSTSMILMGDSNYVTFEHIHFSAYNSASYTGTLIDNGAASWAGGTSSHFVTIDHCSFFGAAGSWIGIKVGAAYSWTIQNSYFKFGDHHIEGGSTSDDWSNTVTIRDNSFMNQCVTVAILNPNTWLIDGNVIEPIFGGAPGALAFSAGVSTNMLTFSNNWCGDVSAQGTLIEAAGDGWIVDGNLIHTGSGSIGIEIVGDMSGLSVSGNQFYSDGTSIAFGTTHNVGAVSFLGNHVASTSYSGTLPMGTIWQTEDLLAVNNLTDDTPDTAEILARAEMLLQSSNYGGTTEWLDESGNGHHAQLGDGVTPATYPTFANDEFNLDGVAQYFEIADHSDLNFTAGESLTVLVAVRPTVSKPTTDSYLFCKGAQSGDPGYASWQSQYGTNLLKAQIHDGTVDAIDEYDSAFSAGVLAVHGLRRNVTTDEVEAFSDGVGTGTPTPDTTTGTLVNTWPLYLGILKSGYRYFDGAITAVAIWREALTDTEIRVAGEALLSGVENRLDLRGSGTPESNVIAPVGATYRRLDGGAGTTLYVKESGASNTGWVAIPGASAAAYTPTNVSTDRSYDADTVVTAELADIVGTLIADLQATGLIG